jgi:WD40 repeat protein
VEEHPTGLDSTARLWDAASGKEIRRFEGYPDWDWVESVAFSTDGWQVPTGSGDNTVRLWDAASGKELCQLISFRDGSWAVIAPDGYYDSSQQGCCPWLKWFVGRDVHPVTWARDQYYQPGLLARVAGFTP